MRREHHRWYTHRLGREMDVLRLRPLRLAVLAFPTSGGDEREYEGQGMIEALAHHIDGGRVKVFCVDTVNNESWYNKQAHPRHRSWVQAQYDAYIPRRSCPSSTTTAGPGHRHRHDGQLVRRVPRREHAPEASRPVPPVPRPVRRVRHPPVHGRRLRRQLLLQQPGRLHGEPVRSLVPRTTCTSATSSSPPVTAPSRTAGPTYRLAEVLRAKGIPHSVDDWGPTAATTGRSGSAR